MKIRSSYISLFAKNNRTMASGVFPAIPSKKSWDGCHRTTLKATPFLGLGLTVVNVSALVYEMADASGDPEGGVLLFWRR